MYNDIWYKINENINLSIPIVERKDIYLEINKVIIFLNSLENCNYFFSCGTALGLVREGRLLDWDTDVDIDVIEPNESTINEIIHRMEELGYSYLRKLKSKDIYSQIVFTKEPHHSIDFCFWYKERNFFINDVPETKLFKRSHPLNIYKEFKYLRVQNIDFRIPFDTDSYFKLLYGGDWQTPKKYTNWFKNANDLKIDFNLFKILNKIIWRINIFFDKKKNS
jgi:hypothetical protein